MSEQTALRRSVESHGGLVAAASELGVSKSVLWAWIARGQVPANKCAMVASKLGVAYWDLRPADWHRIWPELIGTPGAPAVPEAAAQ